MHHSMITPHPFQSIIIVFCLSLTPFMVVSAQQEDQVSLQFVSFPRSANPAQIELISGDGETILIEAPTNSVSKTYKVNRMANWALGKSSTDAEGEFSFQAYGKAKSIAAKTQLILVIRKGKTDADGLEIIPIANKAAGFGGGKCFVMNATRIGIAGDIGNKKFKLKPGKNTVLKPEASREKNNRKYSNAYIYFNKNGKAEPFFSSVWRMNDKARNLVFIYHEPLNQRLRLHIIRDYL